MQGNRFLAQSWAEAAGIARRIIEVQSELEKAQQTQKRALAHQYQEKYGILQDILTYKIKAAEEGDPDLSARYAAYSQSLELLLDCQQLEKSFALKRSGILSMVYEIIDHRKQAIDASQKKR